MKIWQKVGPGMWKRNFGCLSVILFQHKQADKEFWWYILNNKQLSKTFLMLNDCLGDMIVRAKAEGSAIVAEASNINTGIKELEVK